ncbi:hypothetical protein, partial [Microbacterium sp. Bi128]|uniref:hypothetical protein n=1 Tax=Microbacterium sp. Bi128 TaxID=2821115 RepID=UPI001E5A1B50
MTTATDAATLDASRENPPSARVLVRSETAIEQHTLYLEAIDDDLGSWVRIAPADAGGPVMTLD